MGPKSGGAGVLAAENVRFYDLCQLLEKLEHPPTKHAGAKITAKDARQGLLREFFRKISSGKIHHVMRLLVPSVSALALSSCVQPYRASLCPDRPSASYVHMCALLNAPLPVAADCRHLSSSLHYCACALTYTPPAMWPRT